MSLESIKESYTSALITIKSAQESADENTAMDSGKAEIFGGCCFNTPGSVNLVTHPVGANAGCDNTMPSTIDSQNNTTKEEHDHMPESSDCLQRTECTRINTENPTVIRGTDCGKTSGSGARTMGCANFDMGCSHKHPIISEQLSCDSSEECAGTCASSENDICVCRHVEHIRGKLKDESNASHSYTGCGAVTGTAADGQSHHGKSGPVGEPGYTLPPDNETTRLRGKKGRSEIEALGTVTEDKTSYSTERGANMTSKEKHDKQKSTYTDDTTVVVKNDDNSLTESTEEVGEKAGKVAVPSTNMPNFEMATAGGNTVVVGDHTTSFSKLVINKHLSNSAHKDIKPCALKTIENVNVRGAVTSTCNKTTGTRRILKVG